MHFTLGIASLSETNCAKKRSCYIISRKKKIFLEQEEDEQSYISAPAEIGKIIHFLIQNILKNYREYIEYYHFRKKQPLNEAIMNVSDYLMSYFDFLFGNMVEMDYITEIGKNEIQNEIENQKPIYSGHIGKLLNIWENKKITTKIIDEEFEVNYQIREGILCTGKIDLVSYDKIENCLEFYEIKTAKPTTKKLTDYRRQLKLYKETFEKNEKKPLRLYLWNTKPGLESKGFGVISPVKTTTVSETRKVKDFIKFTMGIKRSSDLPKGLNRDFAMENCQYCPYCDNIRKLFPETQQKIDPYFKNQEEPEILEKEHNNFMDTIYNNEGIETIKNLIDFL